MPSDKFINYYRNVVIQSTKNFIDKFGKLNVGDVAQKNQDKMMDIIKELLNKFNSNHEIDEKEFILHLTAELCFCKYMIFNYQNR